jgi:trans-aconitate methyltransferase
MTLFYNELAHWWPLISPVEDYADECTEIVRVLREQRPHARTLLELGSGGGHVAYYLKGAFECHLSDLSSAMLVNSRRLNPECTHVLGDMRSLDLGRVFDLVLAHDAIAYMTSESDLTAVFATAWRHLRPGGLALFIPDEVEETFKAGVTDVSGGDDPDGRAVRLFEWAEAVQSNHTVPVHYAFLLRHASGAVQCLYEQHVVGVFPRTTWERLLAAQGFKVEVVLEHTEEERRPRLFFLGHKPEVSR